MRIVVDEAVGELCLPYSPENLRLLQQALGQVGIQTLVVSRNLAEIQQLPDTPRLGLRHFQAAACSLENCREPNRFGLRGYNLLRRMHAAAIAPHGSFVPETRLLLLRLVDGNGGIVAETLSAVLKDPDTLTHLRGIGPELRKLYQRTIELHQTEQMQGPATVPLTNDELA